MPRFDWRNIGHEGLENRYEGQVGDDGRALRGRDAWRSLARWLTEHHEAFLAGPDADRVAEDEDDDKAELPGQPDPFEWHAADDPAWAVFDEFLRRVELAAVARPVWRECCVFVSHKSADTLLAERVAWLVAGEQFDYWLDVHDPVLARINGRKLRSPAKDILVAAAIEMALLNCSHVIALHTTSSHKSQWIPYEYGRAKARRIVSSQACSWFHPTLATPPRAGGYTWLGVRTNSEPGIRAWLGGERARQARLGPKAGCISRTASAWPAGKHEPTALPAP